MAIIIVQVLYGMMSVSADNNNNVEYKHVMEEYYHMVLKGLNEDQARYLIKDEGTVFKSDVIFEVVSSEQYVNALTGDERYDVYLYFTGDLDQCMKRFEKNYQPDRAALGGGRII